MESDQVAVEHRPSASQIKNFRPQKQEKQQKSAADCVASLREFCEKPPPQVTIHEEGLQCSAEAVRIMFSFDLALEWLQTQDLPCFLMDFTWKTNRPGLVLGAIGPVGLKAWADGKPHMRFCPIVFMLSHAEDLEPQKMLVEKYISMAKQVGVTLTDGFFDCSCFLGAQSALQSEESMRAIRLHRCLQHSKENLKREGKRRDPQSGDSRLRGSGM